MGSRLERLFGHLFPNVFRVRDVTSTSSKSARSWKEECPWADYEIVIVGGGVAGAALASVLGRNGREVVVLERDWREPDRIVGELLQPGGVDVLERLGLTECLEGIDAVRVEGYSIFLENESVPVKYPKKDGKEKFGCSFHHGRFVQNLRKVALSTPNVTCLTATVTGLVEEEGTIRGVKYRDENGGMSEVRGLLTFVCDGSGSILRKSVSDAKPHVRSHFVALLMENASSELPYPNHGHVVLADPSPVLAYPISPTEVRVLVDVPGKLPSVANGEMQEYLLEKIYPQLPEKIQPFFRSAVENGRIRSMPNREMPGEPAFVSGAVLLGDAFNCRHPLTGGGMTVALSDVELLSNMVLKIDRLNDYSNIRKGLEKFYEDRKKLAATINILAGALYSVFAATDDPALPYMRRACFDYFKLGGVAVSGPIGLISGITPNYYLLITHFFAVALFGVLKLLFPFPTPSRVKRAFNIIRAASHIVQPLMRKEKVLEWIPDVPF